MYVTLQSIREQSGFQFKVRAENLGTGDGSTVDFYTDHKPIVDSNQSGTPVTVADVVVYVVSATPVAVSSVNAEQGKIVLSATPISASPITIDYDWSNLSIELVTEYGDEAHSLVLSKLSEVYTLPLSETPDIIKLIEKKLAAGLLLDKEYSVGGDETEDTRGRRWIKWAEEKLDDIVSGKLELLDNSGNVLTQKSGVGLDGFPNENTKDLPESESGGEIQFRIKKEF